MKVYARQINPEYQESPLFWSDVWPENVVFTGNRHYNEHTIPAWEKLGSVEEVIDSYGPEEWYRNITEALNDLVPRDDEKGYNTRQVHEWKKLLDEWDIADDECKAEALSLITGKKYDYTTLRGCSQGEWIDIFYPAEEWGRKPLDCLEMEYFNTGSEWIIHDTETEPETPEDISGYSVYCYGWDTDSIKDEIKEITGAEEVVLYEYRYSYGVESWEVA